MKSKLNGLVVTYCYPPYKSPESFVTFKLIKSLSTKCDITILRPKFYEDDFKDSRNNGIKEIRVNIPRLLKKILEIKRLPIRPDRFILYYFIFKKFMSKININDYDFFMTRSQFHSSHMLGLYIKKKYNIPWVAHFSDPWYENPVQKNIFFFEKISLALQKKVFEKTDINLFPLEELKDFFNKQLNKDITKNSFIIPHSTSNLYLGKKKKTIKDISIRFFGKIYAGRKVKNSLIALSNLINDNSNIKVEFFIDDDFFQNYSHILKKYPKIKFFNYLEYHLYLKKLRDTSILLLIDIDEKHGNLFFQSKLVDYLESYSQILHIGKSNTFNKKIILKNNGLSCLNDPIQIYKKLKQCINQVHSFKPNYKLLNSFSPESISTKLFKIIKKEKEK